MIYKNVSLKINKFIIGAIASTGLLLSANTYAAEASGNIGVYSKYLLRGIAEENSGAALQGGYDLNFDLGFYLGYWGSSLSYNDAYTSTGFENDFYGGYTGSIGSHFGYTVGLIQYYYLSVDDSDLTELVLAADFKYVTLQAQYLLNDGFWGNSGDTYWTLSGDYDIPKDFNIGFSVGYYTYNDDDAGNSKLGVGPTLQTSAFRHVNISLSHPVGKTGADMGITYTIAGEDRTKTEFDDTIVMSLTYGFDI